MLAFAVPVWPVMKLQFENDFWRGDQDVYARSMQEKYRNIKHANQANSCLR